ncbi:MAG: ATP-binding protein [bacterium]
MENPFIYGEVVTGDNFCNREKEIKKLSNDLLDSQKIFLISPRRFGKTSLIKTVLEEIRRQNIRTVYLDIEGISTYKKFLNTYLNALIKEFTTINKIYEFTKKILSGIKFELNVDDKGNPALTLGYKSLDENLEMIASKIYELPAKITKRERLVIVFDEFQEILKLNGRHIEGVLRSAIQHQRNVGYIFAGSRRHILVDMATSPDRPFYRMGPVMYLERIPEEIIKKFIYKKFCNTGIKISKIAVAKIIEMSENIPYYIQMLSHELWDYAVIQKKGANEKDIGIVFKELLKQYDQNFREHWNRLITTKRQLLQTIAHRGGNNLLSKEILSKNELGYPSSVQRTLELLIADGHIDKVGNTYFMVDIVFREWIRQFTF